MVSMTAHLGSVSRSPSGVSMAVHRVGKTLLIDELNAPLFFRGVVGHLRLWVAVAYSWVAIVYSAYSWVAMVYSWVAMAYSWVNMVSSWVAPRI